MDLGLSQQTLTSRHSSAKKLPQFIAAICATIGGFVMGLAVGWSSPAGDKIQADMKFLVRDHDKDLISSLMPLGAMAGAFIGAPICNTIGRRTTLILQIVPSLLGWLLIIFAQNVNMIYAGRFFTGLVGGLLSVVAPLYTNEISEVNLRGTTGTFFQLQCTIGILFTYVVGHYLTVPWFTVACAVFPTLMAVLMIFQPESPKFYLTKGKRSEALNALERLRGPSYDCEFDIQEIQSALDVAAKKKVSLSKAFASRAALKGLIIGIAIMFFQQLSGINAVIFYTNTIFEAAKTSLEAYQATIIVGAIMVVATFFSTLIIERLGRKPLLLLSDSVMALSAIVLGVYFYLQEKKYNLDSWSWLPILALSVFVIVFSLGFGPIPWMFMAEIFSLEVQGPACTIACLLNWLFAFLVTFFFNDVSKNLGIGETFWILGGISAVGTLFVAIFVPETKGKTLDEVIRILEG